MTSRRLFATLAGMTETDRFQLLYGPYATPLFDYGDVVVDEVRDCDVTIVDISNARIPWPIGQREGSSARQLVIYGQLAEAVRKESNQAVCHWWGVTPQTVTKWRKAIGVGRMTEGSSKLASVNAHEPAVADGLKKAQAKAQDPTRRTKIANSRRGKKRPQHVIDAIRNAHLGKPASDATRKKLSEAHKGRGTRPPKAGRPWTVEEDQLARELPVSEAAVRTGRTVQAIRDRRRKLAKGTKVNRSNNAEDGIADNSAIGGDNLDSSTTLQASNQSIEADHDRTI